MRTLIFNEEDLKKKNKKLGVIYANKDEKGNPLTYSVYTKLNDGSIIELERNSRKPLNCFRKKYF